LIHANGLIDEFAIFENIALPKRSKLMKKILLPLFVSALALNVAEADQALSMKSGCAGCHQMDVKTVGPSVKDIATKHKGGNVDELVTKVKAGIPAGQTTWGQIAMPPNGSSEADIRAVVEWMLSQ
jgi:cytochrome c